MKDTRRYTGKASVYENGTEIAIQLVDATWRKLQAIARKYGHLTFYRVEERADFVLYAERKTNSRGTHYIGGWNYKMKLVEWKY